MFTIINKKSLASDISLIEVFAPRIANVLLPGQFVTLQPTGKSRKIALPVCGWNRDSGTVSLLVQVVDASTEMLAHNDQVSILYDMLGPMGKPSALTECNDRELLNAKILFIANGAGEAAILAQVKWLSDIGCKVDVLLAAKSKNKMLFRTEIEKLSNQVYYATDDGSTGFHGSAAQLLDILLEKDANSYDLITSIGSLRFMKSISAVTLKYGIPATVGFESLLTSTLLTDSNFKIMVGNVQKDVTIDGPEFNAPLIDFDHAINHQLASLTILDQAGKPDRSQAVVHEIGKPYKTSPIPRQA
jgi:ferredoxin--NADP+ reductase